MYSALDCRKDLFVAIQIQANQDGMKFKLEARYTTFAKAGKCLFLAGAEFPQSPLQSPSDSVACANGSNKVNSLLVNVCGFLHGHHLPPQEALQGGLQAAVLASR